MSTDSRNTWKETHIVGGGHYRGASGPTADHLYGYDGLTQDYLARQPDTLNPLLPTYFQFSIKRCPNVTYFCQSVNLPGINITPIPQPTRFVSIPHAPGIPEFDDLVINFIVDENLTNWLEMYNWMKTTVTTKDHKDYDSAPEHYTDASLTILNSAMKPKIRVEFFNCLPTNLSALEFDSTTTNPDALIANATFKFTTYEITKLS
tara:strand:- start:280 stop:894 length:615 start_codon:yes stop_codon:yes gene_type:complete